jgi:hypothetical protein
MNSGNGSRIAVVLGIIVVLALILFGVYRVLRPSNPAPKPGTPPANINLLDYIDRNTQVRYTIEGPVTANENHNTIRIAVTKDNRIIEVLSTYNGDTTISQTFTNNAAAFEDFMYAINGAGFMKRDPKATTADERGVCPTGQRYIYELIENGSVVNRLWSSSCGDGNFAGQTGVTQTLFQAQIPGYSKITSNVRFSLQ